MTGDLGPLDESPENVRPPFDARPVPDHDHSDQEAWRARRRADNAAAIREALDGVELGAYDERLIEHLAGSDIPEIGGIVSWLRRARQAGRAEGDVVEWRTEDAPSARRARHPELPAMRWRMEDLPSARGLNPAQAEAEQVQKLEEIRDRASNARDRAAAAETLRDLYGRPQVRAVADEDPDS